MWSEWSINCIIGHVTWLTRRPSPCAFGRRLAARVRAAAVDRRKRARAHPRKATLMTSHRLCLALSSVCLPARPNASYLCLPRTWKQNDYWNYNFIGTPIWRLHERGNRFLTKMIVECLAHVWCFFLFQIWRDISDRADCMIPRKLVKSRKYYSNKISIHTSPT